MIWERLLLWIFRPEGAGFTMKGKYDPAIHHRRSIRLKGYDYTRPGAYYVTICLLDKNSWLLGEMINGKVQVSRYGEIVWKCWSQLPRHYPNAKLDEFIVMPNHVHGVIWLMDPNECVGAGLQDGNFEDVKPARTAYDAQRRNGAWAAGIGDNVGAGLQDGNFEDVKPARTADDADDADIFDGKYDGYDSGAWNGRLIMAKSEGSEFAGESRKPGRVKIKYPLPEIIRGFKTFSARRINELRGIAGVPVWQRNYWEHIVRDEEELRRIREYIVNNPVRWEKEKNRVF